MNTDKTADSPFKDLRVICFVPSLLSIGRRDPHDKARMELLFMRIHTELDVVHPNFLGQTGMFQVIHSTDTESRETTDVLLDSAPALRRLRFDRWKHHLTANSMLDVSAEKKFNREDFLGLVREGVRILFVLRPSRDVFFFSRITGIKVSHSAGQAAIYHVAAHLLGKIEPVECVV